MDIKELYNIYQGNPEKFKRLYCIATFLARQFHIITKIQI